MAYFVKFLTLSAVLALAIANFPLDTDELVFNNYLDDTIYRLPEDLDPIHCDVEITPYFEAADGFEAWTFDGIVTHRVRASTDHVTSLYLQENVRIIKGVTVTNENGVPVRLDVTNPFNRIRDYHFLEINLAQSLTYQEEYFIRVEYIGNINETPLSRGVFRGNYLGNDGKLHWYLATHLQPTHSRQAFPSFDEPGFKQTFNLIINRPAHFTETYANMQIKESIRMGDRVKEIFHTTPRMSAYLLTFHVSEEFTVIADNNDPQRSYRILARPNAIGQGEYALEVGPPLTVWLENYFNIDYYAMAPGMKNDQIASPFWASGATENWGLVTYREMRLLYEQNETNDLDKMYIGTITAHELAHKWFGNLITCRWWDNVWINEGFASYFEYFAMDGVDSNLELADQFNLMYLQAALSTDSSVNTRALRHTVNSPAQVTGHFTGISYSKGASFLLMMKHFVTEDTFKDALHDFLISRSFEHAFPEDLYKSFDKAVRDTGTLDSTFDIEAFMEYWVDQPGYPVVEVTVNMETGVMRLRQERYFTAASTPSTEQIWPIPLTYTTGSDPDWNALRPTHVMTTREDEIQKTPRNEWVIFNVQQKGIYRVNYDAHNWELIIEALRNNVLSIHHLNRAQIVSDVFAFARAGRLSYDLAFRILDFLKRDTSYYSWYPAVDGFTWLRNRFLHIPTVLAKFDEYIFEYVDAVMKDLGFENDPEGPLTRNLNRFFLMAFACNIGHPECTQDAIDKFTALMLAGERVAPNLRRHVFCVGIRYGGYIAWRFIYNRRLLSNNQADELVMLRALGCASDNRSRQEYLEMILTDDVKAQDTVNAFTFFYMGGRPNAKVALEFLKERHEDIRQAVVLPAWFENVLSNLAAYLEEDDLLDMENWLNANQANIPGANAGLSGINSARSNMAWGTDNAERVLEALEAARDLQP